MRPVDDVFEAELEKRGVRFKRLSLREYEVDANGELLSVSIENLNRDFMRDGDVGAVARFVDAVLNRPAIPKWEQARELLFWSAEPADLELDDVIFDRVSRRIARVLVLTDAEERGFSWVSTRMLEDWSVTESAAREAATTNQAKLLSACRVEVANVGEAKVGMVPIGSALKASVIFAPPFKQFVADAIGWPVFVVIPCRDFILITSVENEALLGQMGGVVQAEYRKSAYPIATEVLRISDEGITALGAFPE